MIEVFKTNVVSKKDAKMILEQIHACFSDYRANFDLDDYDKILRVENRKGYVDSSFLIKLLDSFGFYAEILPDDDPAEMSYGNNLVSQTSIDF